MSETRQVSLRRAQIVALVGLVIQIVMAGAVFAVAMWCKSRAVMAEAYHLAAGVWLWLVIILHLRHQRAAQEEAAEVEELMRIREQNLPGRALFEGDEEDLNVARKRLQTFEKYFLPICSLVLAGLLVGGAVQLYSVLTKTVLAVTPTNASLSAAFLVAAALITFLIAKYAAGMATERVWRPLRAGGSYLVSCAIMLFAVSLGMAFVHFKLPVVDRVLAYVVPGGMCLVAIEVLLNILLDLYRPRVEGQEPRFAYDSRLLGLLVEPAGVARTVAETLDYQFGFKISETWGYRFVERAIAPLILFQVITFYLLTCILIIGPEEQAFVERFGEPINAEKPLDPGLHLKWPWPIDIARRFPAARIRVLRIGESGKPEDEPPSSEEGPEVILWTESHSKTVFRWMVGSAGAAIQSEAMQQKAVPVSFLTGKVDVFYRIDNLYDFMYRHVDGDATLRELTNRALADYMTSVDLNKLLTSGREAATQEMRARIQEMADAHKVGVKILSVGLFGVHPPIEVGKAYESVVAATQTKEATIRNAEAYERKLVPEAKGEAAVRKLKAEGDSIVEQLTTAGQAERFKAILAAYDPQALRLMKVRYRLNALVEALENARKYIAPVWAGQNEVDVIDLQEKLQLDILNAALPEGVPEQGSESSEESSK